MSSADRSGRQADVYAKKGLSGMFIGWPGNLSGKVDSFSAHFVGGNWVCASKGSFLCLCGWKPVWESREHANPYSESRGDKWF